MSNGTFLKWWLLVRSLHPTAEKSDNPYSKGVDVLLIPQNLAWAQHLVGGVPNLFPSPPLLSWHAQCRWKQVLKTAYKATATAYSLKWRSSLCLSVHNNEPVEMSVIPWNLSEGNLLTFVGPWADMNQSKESCDNFFSSLPLIYETTFHTCLSIREMNFGFKLNCFCPATRALAFDAVCLD